MHRGVIGALAGALMVAAVAVGGCGGSSNANDASPAPTKSEFIRQADAICKAQNEERITGLGNFYVKYGQQGSEEKANQEELVRTVALPTLREEATQLSSLAPPSADKAEMKTIIKLLEEGIGKVEEHPILVLTNSSALFTNYDKTAQSYGFKICGRN